MREAGSLSLEWLVEEVWMAHDDDSDDLSMVDRRIVVVLGGLVVLCVAVE
jgi:hypothetical protein